MILDAGADIKARDKRHRTPLHRVARHNQNPELLALLLDRGADSGTRDDRGRTPLHHGVRRYSTEQLGLPPSSDGDLLPVKCIPVLRALDAARLKWLTLLLDHGADVNARDDRGRTPLHAAARDNSAPGVLALLLDRGADPNDRDNDGRTPLFRATRTGRKEDIGLLLDRGADATATDDAGETALHMIWGDDAEGAALLVSRGVDVNARNDRDETPLHMMSVCAYSHDGIAFLLREGARINARDCTGRTALHWAAAEMWADGRGLELLLDCGADASLRDSEGKSAADLAGEHGALDDSLSRRLRAAETRDGTPTPSGSSNN